MSVRLSAHPSTLMEQLDSHRTDLHQILYLSPFLKPVQEIRIPLTSDTNNGYNTLTGIHIF